MNRSHRPSIAVAATVAARGADPKLHWHFEDPDSSQIVDMPLGEALGNIIRTVDTEATTPP